MIKQTKGKIFLADERGVDVAAGFLSLKMFNSGNYFNEHRKPFGDIVAMNDEALDAGCSHTLLVKECCYVVLLPIAGAIGIKYSPGRVEMIAAGQSFIISAEAGTTIEIKNPFNKGAVNFLQLLFRRKAADKNSYLNTITYDVNEQPGALLNILPGQDNQSLLPFRISIGKFWGRDEADYYIQNTGSGIFVFVIEGAFEVEGRLLHPRDGLALWNTGQAELEALSNEAIILIVETSGADHDHA